VPGIPRGIREKRREVAMEQARTSEIEIRHEEQGDHGAFYVQTEAGRLAELTYSRTSSQTVVIEHTEVSNALAGRGVGRLLIEAAVEWARRTGTKFVPVCTYAKTVFERYPGLRDVLR
jgi:predicted GNAT family acetyltransferase